jgi:hypothetical protein
MFINYDNQKKNYVQIVQNLHVLQFQKFTQLTLLMQEIKKYEGKTAR